MSDQMKLSQAEIDALLNTGNSAKEPEAPEQTLTDIEADTLGEIGNITFGSAATSLSTLLQHRVDITTPEVSVMAHEQIREYFPHPYVLVAVEFTEGIIGSNALAIEIKDAKTIADLMLGGDGTNVEGDLNEMHLSAVGEAMNQMMGGAATSMSQMFGRSINISPPRVEMVDLSTDDQDFFEFDGDVVNIQFQLRVGELIDSRIMQLVPFEFAKNMVQMLYAGPASESSSPAASEPSPSEQQTPQTASDHAEIPASRDQTGQQTVQGVENQSRVEQRPGVRIQKPEFVDFETVSTGSTAPNNLSLLFDVQLNVTVELGRAKKIVREVLDLGPGSILELDKLAGEPVDIYVNNKRIAIGEVVVIDENFGVRVTDIIRPEQRVSHLS